jgi:4,5-dihydroxyphthalate decarboxylase
LLFGFADERQRDAPASGAAIEPALATDANFDPMINETITEEEIMNDLVPLTIACGDYDRTRALSDGRESVEGCRVNFLPLEPEEVFFRSFRNQEFDVAELSFSSYCIATARGDSAYIGIPAFVSRCFRHSGIYVRKDAGIKTPQDLRGKRIGVPEYQLTALVWIRGMLQEEFGVKPSESTWFGGGQEEPGRDERTPIKMPSDVKLTAIPHDKTLVQMLLAGELDALFTARAPSCYENGHPNVDRLFPNYREVEKAYWSKTGLFPIMHLIGIKKDLVARHPWLPTSVYKAFLSARNFAYKEAREVAALHVTLPWVEAEARETVKLMGKDYWPYGVKESARDIEAMTSYSFAQGLASKKLTPADLFAPGTLEISKI